jgi:hypothetical protein
MGNGYPARWIRGNLYLVVTIVRPTGNQNQ